MKYSLLAGGISTILWGGSLTRDGMGFVPIAVAYICALAAQIGESEKPTIPLSQIVTTSPQPGLRHVRDVLQKPKRDPEILIRQLNDVSHGSSNVFLVDALKLDDALSASFTILTGTHTAETPAAVNTSKPRRGSHWLVAYLGSGPSSPTWWAVETVFVDKSKVVLRYRKSKPMPATRDVLRYYYWIPLGKLNSGTYELELVNADKDAVTLMRRVEVTAEK